MFILPLAALASNGDGREALMDRIEARLVLPQGARRFSDYGRNYAFEGQGRVRAVYLIPRGLPDKDEGCEVLTEDLGSRPCIAREIRESRQSAAKVRAASAQAGRRRWYAYPRDLPMIFDGGCMMVTIEFEISSGRFLRVACNGLG